MTRIRIAMVVALVAMGCTSSRPAADIERGKQAVAAALDSWKTKQPRGELKSQADSVEFAEELRATHTLTDYDFGRVDASDREVIRYTVTLRLKDKKGKAISREVVYAVALRNPVVVARDPYF